MRWHLLKFKKSSWPIFEIILVRYQKWSWWWCSVRIGIDQTWNGAKLETSKGTFIPRLWHLAIETEVEVQ